MRRCITYPYRYDRWKKLKVHELTTSCANWVCLHECALLLQPRESLSVRFWALGSTILMVMFYQDPVPFHSKSSSTPYSVSVYWRLKWIWNRMTISSSQIQPTPISSLPRTFLECLRSPRICPANFRWLFSETKSESKRCDMQQQNYSPGCTPENAWERCGRKTSCYWVYPPHIISLRVVLLDG